MKWLYIFTAIISAIETIIFYENYRQKFNPSQVLLFFSTVIATYGYCIICCANSVGVAMVGTQCYNIGSILVMLCLTFVIADLTKHSFMQIPRVVMLVYACVIQGLLITTFSTKLYYERVVLIYDKSFSYLVKTNGKLHFLCTLFIAICIFGSYILVFSSIMKKRKFSIKTLVYMLMMTSLTGVAFFFRLIPNFSYDFVPFVFVINLGILLVLLRKANLYDMAANLLNVYERRYGYGYITFDIEKRFMGCNSLAVKLFPELDNLRIDEIVLPSNSVFYNKIYKWLDSWNENYRSEQIVETEQASVFCTLTNLKYKKNVGYLVELRDETKQQEYIHLITDYNYKLENVVQAKNNRLVDIQDSIIRGMASMVESRDNSTGGHINRTSLCVRAFINVLRQNKELDFSDKFCIDIEKAAPLHDLGKIAVSDSILCKPGKYTKEEYEQMKKHSAEGARIVKDVLKECDDEEFMVIAENVAHYHHERWDGSGYPCGLKGEEIPVEARIMAIADVFDALVSKRCYKDAFSYKKAKEIIEESLGSHFDPKLGKVFLENWDVFVKLYKDFE